MMRQPARENTLLTVVIYRLRNICYANYCYILKSDFHSSIEITSSQNIAMFHAVCQHCLDVCDL